MFLCSLILAFLTIFLVTSNSMPSSPQDQLIGLTRATTMPDNSNVTSPNGELCSIMLMLLLKMCFYESL